MKLEISLGQLITMLTLMAGIIGSYTLTVHRMEAHAKDIEWVKTEVRGIQADSPALEGRLTRIEVGIENLNSNFTRWIETQTRN